MRQGKGPKSLAQMSQDEKKRMFLKSIGMTDVMTNDDMEIRYLEKQLGLNKKKNKDIFAEDGLDILFKPVKYKGKSDIHTGEEQTSNSDALMDDLEDALNGIDGSDGDDGDQYDMPDDIDDSDLDIEDVPEGDDDDEEEEEMDYDQDDLEMEDDQDELDGDEEDEDQEDEEVDEEEEEEEEEEERPMKKQAIDRTKEDIYGRLVDTKTGEIIKDNKGVGSEGAGKYIPPHLRAQQAAQSGVVAGAASTASSLSAEEASLKRKLNGLLNKLATNNFHVIYNDIVQQFNEKPRNDKEQLVHNIIHANVALVSAIHGGIGTDIGGYFIEELFKKYQSAYQRGAENETSNLLLTIIHLYNFQVLNSILIVDLAKTYLESFSELDISLVLLVLQNGGYQLRADDPVALKDIVLLVQKKQTELKEKEGEVVSKVSFMMELITNLKNNKIKNTKLIDTLATLRKAVRSLLRASDTSMSSSTLRISLKDLESVDTNGRWWLVGSSWAGNGKTRIGADGTIIQSDATASSLVKEKASTFTNELLQLAKANRMTTDLQKAIFCIVMSSIDYIDAFEKLMELELKDKQDREVVQIILHCCMKERKFNPYYLHLLNRLCNHDGNYKFTLQYNLWDKLKELKSMTGNVHGVVSLANLMARLVETYTFTLSVLRVIEFDNLDPVSIAFFRVFFTYLLTTPTESEVESLFERLVLIQQESIKSKKKGDTKQADALHALIKGIKIFFMHGLLSVTPPANQKEKESRELLRQRVKLVKTHLKTESENTFL
eukprot:gene19015-22761_t